MKRSTHRTICSLLIGMASVANGQIISEDLKLVPGDGTVGQEFGCAVEIDQGIMVIGARGDSTLGTDAGAAYLFDTMTGALIAKLLPDDGAAGDSFGYSVAIHDGVVAVGAPEHDDSGTDSGAAYLFDASTGAQLMKITPNDAEEGDEFGNSIDIDGGTIAVGAWRADEFGDASGAAYLFDASTGIQTGKVLPATGGNFQTFGVSVAVDDGIVAVGARTFFVLGDGFTFARVYLFDASTGAQTGVLRADIENFNGDQGGHFGDSVDIDDGIVAVGAWGRSIFFDHSGAAYTFDASTGEQLQFIFPADGQDRDNFGVSVAIDNGVIAIGSHQDDVNGFNAGSAYLYDGVSGVLMNKVLASDGAPSDFFGTSVAIENEVIAIGAIGDEDNGSRSGSVYLVGSSGASCPADLTGDGNLDFFDVSAFLSAYNAMDPIADFTGDGVYDFFDVSAFLSAYNAGCP